MSSRFDRGRHDGVDDDGTPKTVTGSLNRGLHPSNMPTDKLRQYMPGDVDDEDAAAVHNPHQWDDPERSWRERIVPGTVASKIAAAAVGVLSLGMLVYFYPIVGPLFASPMAIGGAALISLLMGVFLLGCRYGYNNYRDLEKWVRFEGDEATVAPVERADDGDTDIPYFNVIKRVSLGGFNRSLLLLRHLPFDASKLKRYPGDDGTEPATDAANAWTYRAESEALGTFYVTDTSELAWAKGMEGADRHAAAPDKLDQDKWDEAARLINELQREVRRQRDELEMAMEHAESATDLRDELRLPELEANLRRLEQIASIGQPYAGSGQKPTADPRESQVPVAAPVPQSRRHSYDERDHDDSGDSE